jgi:hypothetical protein
VSVPRGRLRSLLVVLFRTPALVGPVSRAASTCEEVLKSDPGAPVRFRDWTELYASFRKFGACDTGGDISENCSDRIPKLLGERWAELESLETLCGKHSRFRRFILRHINASGDSDALHPLARASVRCPERARSLCEAIHRQATVALAEINEVTGSATRGDGGVR